LVVVQNLDSYSIEHLFGWVEQATKPVPPGGGGE
jgi:hypothetical protein